MKDFFYSVWWDFVILMMHSVRGLAFASVSCLFILFALEHTPHTYPIMPPYAVIDLLPVKRVIFFGGISVCTILALKLWVLDWQNNYWKIRW